MVEPLPWEYWFALRETISSFDVFHFHDLYMAISPANLAKVATHRPVVFTLHDTSAFTGGCINPQNCQRFRSNCGACPKRRELGRFDFTRANLKRMRRLALSPGLSYICPSRWIKSEAAHSLGTWAKTEHLPNGFDACAYEFRSQVKARALLGLPQDGIIVALSCASFENKLKGIELALEALRSNRDLNITALLIGQTGPQIPELLKGVKCVATGFLHNRTELGLWYSSADLLLYPSLGDNLPITVQEAMAAGTPVVAFRVGGIPELVEDGKTGWLVPLGDQKGLNEALRRALESGETRAFGDRARSFITEQFSRERCVERHLEVYQSAIERWRAEAARS
jgi:glycosyltransferase involved in cell wall biosynthesis